MDPNAKPADRMAELPEKTRTFLAQLREEDIDTLNACLKLVVANHDGGSCRPRKCAEDPDVVQAATDGDLPVINQALRLWLGGHVSSTASF